MSQYATNFSEYTVGQKPSDWTERLEASGNFSVVADAAALGGKVLRMTDPDGGAGEFAITWDAIDSDPNRGYLTELLLKIKPPSTSTGYHAYGAYRLQAANGGGYRGGFDYNEAKIFWDDGTNGGYLTSSSISVTAGEPYWIRTKVEADNVHRVKIWEEGGAEPATWTASSSPSDTERNVFSDGLVGVIRAFGGNFDVEYFSAGTNGDAAPTEIPTETQAIRKSSTFDIETTLGTITTATLNSVNVFDHLTGQSGTTVSFDGAATDEVTTSGEYTLTLGDGTGTADITVQVNVVGLANFNINKDGADQGSLTDVEFLIITGAEGSRVISDQIINVTTTAGGDTGAIEITDTSLNDGDTVMVAQRSDTVNGGGGAFHPATLGLI